jgi:hypothetical protein
MHKLFQIGTLGVAGLTTTGLIAFTAPAAIAGDHQTNAVYKRENDSSVLTTADDGDDTSGPGGGDDDTTAGANTNGASNTAGNTGTNTGADDAGDDNGDDNANQNTHGDSNTGAVTRGQNTDHSRDRQVRDLTNDGPGRGNVDHSRHHTNDNSRHNTRG